MAHPYWWKWFHDPSIFPPAHPSNRELKQTRTATAVNKQLNHTQLIIYCILEAYFMTKSLWKTELYWLFWSRSWVTFTNAEMVAVVLKTEKSSFWRLQDDGNLLGGERCFLTDFKIVNTVLSQTFNHKISFKYAIGGHSAWGVCGFLLTLKFSCWFTVVAVL